MYNLNIKYVGKETISTDIGKLRCFKLKPQLVVDRVFKKADAMTVWVTDDLNHMPVRIESEIQVGAIAADAYKWEGLRNPMTAKVK